MFSRGSIKLFEFAGTAVRLHPTFLLLLAWFAAIFWIEGGPQRAISGVILVILLFVTVVMHEFGHILVARRFGARTRDVTLLPIGGVASMENMPEKPSQEIAVALAGPAVNLVIAAILILLLGDRFDPTRLNRIEELQNDLLVQLAVANLVLFTFNLIPAFPMDGGRVLRAALAFRVGYTRATRIAAIIGQTLAIFFGVLGLLGNPLLILIAIFIFMAAAGEAGYVEMRDQVRGRRAREAMIEDFEVLSPSADADAAAALLLRTTQQEFPVVDGAGHLRGVLTRDALITALRQTGGKTPVLEIMTKEIPSVHSDSELESAMRMLQSGRHPAVAVTDERGRMIGYINSQNLAEFFWVRSAEPSTV